MIHRANSRAKSQPPDRTTSLLVALRIHIRVVLRRFSAIEHSIVAHAANPSVTKFGYAREAGWRPSGARVRTFPRSQQQHLARIGDALEHVVFGKSQSVGIEPDMAWQSVETSGRNVISTGDTGSRDRNPIGVKVPSGPFVDILRAWHGELGYDPALVEAPVASKCRRDRTGGSSGGTSSTNRVH